MKLSRVHAWEWYTGLIGLIVVVGLLTSVTSPGVLHAVVLVVAAAGAVLPVAVAASSRTNVPIVYETLLWIVSGLVSLILVVKAVFPSSTGFSCGYLALGGMLIMSFALWRSVAREH